MEEELGRVRVNLKKAMELGSTEAIKQAVAANLGVSIVSKFAISHEIFQGRLAVARLPELNLRRQLFVIHHGGRTLSPAAQEFCSLLRRSAVVRRKTLSPDTVAP
jgi:DNA-binding transcriptional LysR family regulator